MTPEQRESDIAHVRRVARWARLQQVWGSVTSSDVLGARNNIFKIASGATRKGDREMMQACAEALAGIDALLAIRPKEVSS